MVRPQGGMNEPDPDRHRLRHRRAGLWPAHQPAGASRPRRQRSHARSRGSDPGGGLGLSAPPVHDHRGRRRDRRRAGVRPAWFGIGGGLRAWRRPVGRDGLRRHEHLGPRQRPHRRGGEQGPAAGPDHGVPRRGHHGDAGRGAGAARDRRLLLLSGRARRASAGGPSRGPGAGGARVRRVADLDLRAAWRRHLHQGGRRRRRPRRQGRGRHPRG